MRSGNHLSRFDFSNEDQGTLRNSGKPSFGPSIVLYFASMIFCFPCFLYLAFDALFFDILRSIFYVFNIFRSLFCPFLSVIRYLSFYFAIRRYCAPRCCAFSIFCNFDNLRLRYFKFNTSRSILNDLMPCFSMFCHLIVCKRSMLFTNSLGRVCTDGIVRP